MPKINELTNMSSVDGTDLLLIVDTSDTTESASGTTKQAQAGLFNNAFAFTNPTTTPITVDSTYSSGTVFISGVTGVATFNIVTADFAVGDTLFFNATANGMVLDVGSGNVIYNSQTLALGAYEAIGLVKASATEWYPITRGKYIMFLVQEFTAASKSLTTADLNPGAVVTYLYNYTTGSATLTLPSKTTLDDVLVAGSDNGLEIVVKNINGSAQTVAVNAGTSTTIEGGNKTLADEASIRLSYYPTDNKWYVVATYGTVT